MNADVGESGQGFTVVTEHGEIIDLGTRFGVDVGSGDAKVAVFSGEVRVETDGGDRESSSVEVLEGEGVRLRKGNRPSRLSAVWLSQDANSLSASASDSIVVNITDNAQSNQLRRFYGIISGGVRDGTIAYTTAVSTPRRDVVWSALEGESFPSELNGVDVVCPFHTDRRDESLSMTLHVSGPAIAYIMHDARWQPPEWLLDQFQQTNTQILSGPWRPVSPVARGLEPDGNGDFYVQYTIWKKRIDSAGRVELGPPQVEGGRKDRAMYGIAVQPLTRS